MTTSDIQLISLVVGFVGSLISAASTYWYEPSPLAQCGSGSDEGIVNKRNGRRRKGQIGGLLLIALSFFIQIISLIYTQ